MELAYEVVQMKRRTRGGSALNVADDINLRRYDGIQLDHCGLMHPVPEPSSAVELSTVSVAGTLKELLKRLLTHGFEPLILDRSRASWSAKVCRTLCPGLEIEPSSSMGARLAQMIRLTGGGQLHTGGIDLM